MKQGLSLLLSLSCLTLSQGVFLTSATAQVTPDGTTNTTVDVSGNDFTINQGERAGSNLFHSFGEFSVPTDGSAFFNNAAEIVNIFSRVTGGNLSNIDGLLRANSANLFLLNPAGILFGPNARLDIGGSFFGTTADSFLFEDGEFSATDLDNPPLLTINAPIGLNFRDNPGDIVNRSGSGAENGGLQVDTGANLTLVGRNLSLEGGKLTAPGGRIELGGLSTAGTVGINADGSLSFPEGVARANVSLTDGALVNVVDAGGGFIRVNAQNLELREGSQLTGGIKEGVDAPAAQAGDINLDIVEAITIDKPESGIFNDVGVEGEDDMPSSAVGNAGKINVETGSLSIMEGGQIGSTIFGQGNAGDVTVNARENIKIRGFETGRVDRANPTGIFSNLEAGAKGESGTIRIFSDSLDLIDRGQLRTSIGNGAEGKGGDILVTTTGSLTLNNIGRLSASLGREAEGTAGNIVINADTVSLNRGRITSELGDDAVGDAGNIEINANSLTVTSPTLKENSLAGNESEIEVEVENGAEGNAGNILINTTNSVSLSGNTALQSFIKGGAEGDSGSIIIKTSSLVLDKDASITTSTQGETAGNAGKVEIDANTVRIKDGARIASTTEGQGNAGTIEVRASDSVMISGFSDLLLLNRIRSDGSNNPVKEGGSSGLFTSVVGEASGQGGNITILTPDLKILEGAVVSAKVGSEAQGQGGSIIINAETLEISDGGQIIASSLGNGDGGDIELDMTDSIKISGSDPNFSERFKAEVRTRESGEIEPGGNLTEEQGRLEFSFVGIGEESQISGIFADSQKQGSGGSVSIRADSLTLDDGARISSSTAAGAGGNLTLKIEDNLTLKNDSKISAQATSDADGGNVNIDTQFIIAFPSQPPGDGNDILASAKFGMGGNINITAESLFGIEERPTEPGNGTNDIDASSEFGLDGDVLISNPDTNIRQIDTEVPKNIVEPETLGINACSGGGETEASSFTVKGKGGIPPVPTEPFMADALIPDGKPITIDKETELNSLLVEESETEQVDPYYIPVDPNYIPPDIKPIETSMGDIYPARGIIKTEDGEIILTVYPTDNINTRTPHKSANCTP